MSTMVHQFADQIFLRNNGDHYQGTLADFERHYGQPLPPLPDGIDERVYEPGKRHALSADNSVRDGGPMPWPDGDAALEHIGEMIAMKQAEEDAAVQAARDEVVREAEELNAKAEAQSTQQAAEQKREMQDSFATFMSRRNAALDQLAAVLQRAGASESETNEIIDGLWPTPRQPE